MSQKELGKQERGQIIWRSVAKCLVWVGGQGGVEDRVWATLTVTSPFHPKL